MHTRSRFTSVVAMAAALLMVFANVALADTVYVNDVETNGNASRAAGTSGTARAWIAADDNSIDDVPGCNARANDPVTITLTSSDASVVTVATGPQQVTDCGSVDGASFSYTVASGAVPGATAKLTASATGGRVHQGNSGAFTSGSFTVTVSAPAKQNQTITFPQPASPQAYGESFTVAPTASSGLPVSVAASGSCSISGNTVTMTSGSGTCTLIASQAGNASFNAAPDVERTVAAEKRPASVTPNAASKTYGDADPALTGTLSGFLSSDGVTASYSRAAGETVDGGPYAISASLQGDLSNYDVTYNTADFTITKKAASVTPNAASKTYGDGDPGLTGTLSGFLAGDNVTASYSRTAGENAGSYTISATLSPSALLNNYDIDYTTAEFSIDPRPITVTADDKSKVLGADDPALTYSITSGNLVGSDAFTGSLMREAGESVGSYKIQQGTLSAGSNYDLKFVDGNFTIVYDFTGFFRPIDMGGVFNKVKAGQAVPVKFSLGGDQGMDILQGGPKAPTIKCDASAPADAVDETVAATKSSLSYDAASGQYTYVWKTDKGWAGQCRQLQVTLADGKTYMANFNFTK